MIALCAWWLPPSGPGCPEPPPSAPSPRLIAVASRFLLRIRRWLTPQPPCRGRPLPGRRLHYRCCPQLVHAPPQRRLPVLCRAQQGHLWPCLGEHRRSSCDPVCFCGRRPSVVKRAFFNKVKAARTEYTLYTVFLFRIFGAPRGNHTYTRGNQSTHGNIDMSDKEAYTSQNIGARRLFYRVSRTVSRESRHHPASENMPELSSANTASRPHCPRRTQAPRSAPLRAPAYAARCGLLRPSPLGQP